MDTVTLHDHRIVSPSHPDAGMPWLDDREYVVLLAGMRCVRGCTGRFRQAVPRELLTDRSAYAGYLEGLPFEASQAHVCLRKAVVGDRHWCALCGCFADTVDRRGELRQHQRMVRTGDTWDGGVDVERCPGGSVGRKAA